MLIRSQNKKILAILNQITNISITSRDSKFKITAYYSCDDGYDCMGEYSTEEKAIKILDMIQGHAEGREDCIHGLEGYYRCTFQMPQDTEVFP